MSWDIFLDSMPELLEAALATLRMTALSFLLAATLGLAIAILRTTRGGVGRIAFLYIEVVRGMPALTLLFLIYFGLAPLGIVLNTFAAAVVALGLNGAAYLAEVYRAGIQAVDSGQREAAQMLGLRRRQVMREVVLPQAVPIVLPPMGNYVVSLLKDTSIASLISAPELMLRTRDLAGTYYLPMEYYILAGMMYLIMAWPMMHGVRRLERYFGRGRLQGEDHERARNSRTSRCNRYRLRGAGGFHRVPPSQIGDVGGAAGQGGTGVADLATGRRTQRPVAVHRGYDGHRGARGEED
jgi:His/Glu/Gln/Arg/opine family amino acid ABC transporter permease subunit